jgi:membrane protein DedA with SNARE-associated domain
MIIIAGVLNQILGLVWFAIVVYSLYVLITGKNPKNLNKLIWALIIIFIPLVGVIVYWIIERKILK